MLEDHLELRGQEGGLPDEWRGTPEDMPEKIWRFGELVFEHRGFSWEVGGKWYGADN